MANDGYVMNVMSSVSLWLTSTLTLSLRDILYSRATRLNKVKVHIKRMVQKSQVRDVLLSASPTGTKEKQTSSKSKVRNRSCRGLSSHQGISGFIPKLWRNSVITHALNLSHYKKVRIGECFFLLLNMTAVFWGYNSTILKCAAVWRVWWLVVTQRLHRGSSVSCRNTSNHQKLALQCERNSIFVAFYHQPCFNVVWLCAKNHPAATGLSNLPLYDFSLLQDNQSWILSTLSTPCFWW